MSVWLATAVGCALFSKDKPFDVDVGLLDQADLDEPLPDLGFDISLYDERSSWYLPAFLDDDGWGALLLADRILREGGEPGVLEVEVSALAWEQPEPLTLQVVPSSEDGSRTYVLGDEGGGWPDACTLTVTSETTPADHAADLAACLRDWTDASGGPSDLFVEVEATTDAADWSFSASYALSTSEPAVVTCTGQQIIGDELRDEAGRIDLDRLELAGWVAAADQEVSLVAWEDTWDDPAGVATAGGWTLARVEAGQGAWIGSELELEGAVPASIAFAGPPVPVNTFPSSWADTSLASLEADGGFVDACAVIVHRALPNPVWMHFALVGDGVYHGG